MKILAAIQILLLAWAGKKLKYPGVGFFFEGRGEEVLWNVSVL